MSAKRKHRSSSRYLQYLKGDLSPGERYSFERELEADPFEKEGMEGMEMLSVEEVEQDLLLLHDNLRRRLKRRRRIALYSIAASVASILIVGSIFLNIYQLNPDAAKESLSGDEIFMQDEPENQSMSPALEEKLSDRPTPETKARATDIPVPEKEAPVQIEEIAREEQALETAVPEPDMTPAREADKIMLLEAEPQKSPKKLSKGTPEPRSAYATQQVSGVVLSSEDMESLPGACIAIKGNDSGMVADMATLDEVVVVTYGMQKEATPSEAAEEVKLREESDSNIISGAEPEGGLDAYKIYMEEHIRFPAGETRSKRELVILKFKVNADGSISDITTLRSPGEQFTELAIKLIKDGPSWKPARDENGNTDDVVRMRIVFKR